MTLIQLQISSLIAVKIKLISSQVMRRGMIFLQWENSLYFTEVYMINSDILMRVLCYPELSLFRSKQVSAQDQE